MSVKHLLILRTNLLKIPTEFYANYPGPLGGGPIYHSLAIIEGVTCRATMLFPPCRKMIVVTVPVAEGKSIVLLKALNQAQNCYSFTHISQSIHTIRYHELLFDAVRTFLIIFLIVASVRCASQEPLIRALHPRHPVSHQLLLAGGDTIVSIVNNFILDISPDNGRTWFAKEVGSRKTSMLKPLTLDAMYKIDTATSHAPFRYDILSSKDAGDTWTQVCSGIASGPVFDGWYLTGVNDFVPFDMRSYSFQVASKYDSGPGNSQWTLEYWFDHGDGSPLISANIASDLQFHWEYIDADHIVGGTSYSTSFNPTRNYTVYSGTGYPYFLVASDTLDRLNGEIPIGLDTQFPIVSPDGKVFTRGTLAWSDRTHLCILRSDDSGRTYGMVHSMDSVTDDMRIIMALDSLHGVGYGTGDLWRTTDGWRTWRRTPMKREPWFTSNRFGRATLYQQDMPAAGQNPRGTILITSDYGNTWSSEDWGMHLRVRNIKAWDSRRWIASCDGRGTLITTDAGESWQEVYFDELFPENCSPVTSTTLEVRAGGAALINDFLTTDFGNTWENWNVSRPAEGRQYMKYDAIVWDSAGVLTAAAFINDTSKAFIVMQTTDLGKSWNPLWQEPSPGRVSKYETREMAFTRTTDGAWFLHIYDIEGNYGGYLYRSCDKGMSWEFCQSSWYEISKGDAGFYAFDSLRWVINSRFGFRHNITTDGGRNWLSDRIGRFVAWESPYSILVVDQDYAKGIFGDFYELNDAEYWGALKFSIGRTQFPYYGAPDPIMHDGFMWFVGRGGIIAQITGWESTTAEPTPAPPAPATPILTCSPNPVRPGGVLEVRYTSDAAGAVPVRMRLIDALGRETIAAATAPQTARTGRMSLSLPANLTAGMYFVEVISREGRAVSGVVVMR